MSEPNQTSATRDFFGRRSANWAEQYASGAVMSDRIERFLAPLRECIPPGASILDLGCGTGDIALAASQWTVTAADLSPRMLDRARDRDQAARVTWIPLDGTRLPFADNAFSAVVSSSVLEYVENLPAHFAEVARVLAPGGWYFATVPDPRDPIRAIERHKQRLARCGIVSWLLSLTRWRDEYEYLRLSINRFPLEEWAARLSEAGLVCAATESCTHPLALLRARKQ